MYGLLTPAGRRAATWTTYFVVHDADADRSDTQASPQICSPPLLPQNNKHYLNIYRFTTGVTSSPPNLFFDPPPPKKMCLATSLWQTWQTLTVRCVYSQMIDVWCEVSQHSQYGDWTFIQQLPGVSSSSSPWWSAAADWQLARTTRRHDDRSVLSFIHPILQSQSQVPIVLCATGKVLKMMF